MRFPVAIDNRLVLGTAQLGMKYGIANKNGKPDYKTAEAIIQTAWEGGIRDFDTAQGYGLSEKIIGSILHANGITEQVRIVSKLNKETNFFSFRAVRCALEKSLKNLRISKIYCIMLHSEKLFNQRGQESVRGLMKLVDADLVDRVGISAYSPKSALQALSMDGVSDIQIPSNLLDRRFEEMDIFQRAKLIGKRIYVRSVFLQGLLLLKWEGLSDSMRSYAPILKKVDSLANGLGIKRTELLLGYAKRAYPDAKIIIGAERPEQVNENLHIWQKEFSEKIVVWVKKNFVEIDEKILDPRLWSINSLS